MKEDKRFSPKVYSRSFLVISLKYLYRIVTPNHEVTYTNFKKSLEFNSVEY